MAGVGEVCGEESPSYSLTTPPEPPSQPAQPKIATKSKTAISLRWTAPTDNGSPIDQYRLEWDQVSEAAYENETSVAIITFFEIFTLTYTHTHTQCGSDVVQIYSGKEKQFRFHHKFPPGVVAKFCVSAHNDVGWR